MKFADVGCGFGGLLVKLAPLYPDTLMLGMELRDKVRPVVRCVLPRCHYFMASFQRWEWGTLSGDMGWLTLLDVQ